MAAFSAFQPIKARSWFGWSCPKADHRWSSRRLLPRQVDGKFSEHALVAFDRDRPAVLLRYDVVVDRETKPGPLAGWLRS
jgi:hypothetical protein